MSSRNAVAIMAVRAALAEKLDLEGEAELPHLVLCTDTVHGSSTYSGPYASRSAALAAANYERAMEADPEERLHFTVEPVFPPIEYHLAASTVEDIAL